MEQQFLRKICASRRTFAIISHPDAGKTTLTEKLLLYSGMIRTAGMVRGRKGQKSAASDWMAMEQERGISVTASAMQFVYKDIVINVLDTPGHEDFSEDTYRTLTAADCAIMVIDASKGVEKQTRKLFEVCHLRKIPVLTFINKMDMPGRDPLDLMDEIEKTLQIRSVAWNWPIGAGKDFKGVFDREKKECLFFTKTSTGGAEKVLIDRCSLQSREVKEQIETKQLETLCQELELLDMAGNYFTHEDFLAGKVTPVFFASALTNFGVEPFFDAFIHIAPSPKPRLADTLDAREIEIDPVSTPFSGYVFKLQANVDKRHRDCMAFLRICSGSFERDMVVKHHRCGREIRLSRPHGMIGGERTMLDVAYAGDVIGVVNPGVFAIGDTISLTGGFNFKPLPKFPPEIFARVRPKDIGKRKSFDKGILQLIDEGAIQLFQSSDQLDDRILAVCGKLQFEVMQYRLKEEYGVDTLISLLPYQCSAWILGDLSTFKKATASLIAYGRDGHPIILFSSQWEKDYTINQNPHHQLVDFL